MVFHNISDSLVFKEENNDYFISIPLSSYLKSSFLLRKRHLPASTFHGKFLPSHFMMAHISGSPLPAQVRTRDDLERADPHIQGHTIQSYSYCSTGKEKKSYRKNFLKMNFSPRFLKMGHIRKRLTCFNTILPKS